MTRRGVRSVSPDALRHPMGYDELRARLRAWPAERLVDLLVDLAQSDWELHTRIDRLLAGRDAPEATALALRASIDRALAVHSVEWNAVSLFIAGLDVVVADLLAFGREHPAPALDLLRYFITALPRVFDAVQGEDELAVFADHLAAESLRLAVRAGLPLQELVEALLHTYIADQYGYLEHVPDVLGRELANALGPDGMDLSALVLQITGDARNSYQAENLEKLAAAMQDDARRVGVRG